MKNGELGMALCQAVLCTEAMQFLHPKTLLFGHKTQPVGRDKERSSQVTMPKRCRGVNFIAQMLVSDV